MLTKREWFAGMAMAGVQAYPGGFEDQGEGQAVRSADALCKLLGCDPDAPAFSLVGDDLDRYILRLVTITKGRVGR